MTEFPERLSVDPAFPGFNEDALYVGAGLVILLDGEEQQCVIAYDVPGSSVTRVCLNTAGHIQTDGDEIRLETLHGSVEVKRRPA